MKFGFKKTIIKEKFFLNINLSIFKKNSFKIVENNSIKNYTNITFKNQLNEQIKLTGNISKKRD